MRSTPNFFKFRQWLGWAMKNDPLGDDHFHANEVYVNNLIDDHEIIPTSFILSYGATMLNDARQYFRKHAYSNKTPIFFCGLDDIENYNPAWFEHDYSIPDFSTLEKTAAMLECGGAQIFFYANRAEDVWPYWLDQGDKFIDLPAPLWFGSNFNMAYCKQLWNDESSCYIEHFIAFYHSDDSDFFPYESNKWICNSGVVAQSTSQASESPVSAPISGEKMEVGWHDVEESVDVQPKEDKTCEH